MTTLIERNESSFSQQLLQLDSSPIKRPTPSPVSGDHRRRNPRSAKRQLPVINSDGVMSASYQRPMASSSNYFQFCGNTNISSARDVNPRERALQQMHHKYCNSNFEPQTESTGLLVESNQQNNLISYCDNRDSDSSDCDLNNINCDILSPKLIIPSKPPMLPVPRLLPHFWQ